MRRIAIIGHERVRPDCSRFRPTKAVGANLFFGREVFTFFGQFENNSNVYGSIRFQL